MVAHVSWMLSDRKEDIAVEALGYILKSEAARDVLRKVVNDGGANVGPIASVRTLVSGEEQARPDLAAFDHEDSVVTGGKHLALTSWARLLKRFEEEGDSESGVDIRQLRALTQRMDGRGFPPLRASEFAPEIPRRLRGLQRLVKDATRRGANAGDVSTKGLKVTPRACGYGRYVRVAGLGAWFDIDANRWARGRYPDTPLWLEFEPWKESGQLYLDARKSLEPLTRRNPPAVQARSRRSGCP